MKDSPPRAPIPPPTAPEAVVERTGSSGPEIEVSALPGGDAEKATASEEAAAKEATAGEEVLAPVVVTSPAETRRP